MIPSHNISHWEIWKQGSHQILIKMILKSIGNELEDVVPVEEIVRIQDADEVALRHPDAFVDGIVQTLVLFAHPAHPAAEPRLIRFDQVDRPVGGKSVDYDILIVGVGLGQNAFERVFQRTGAVERYGND